MNKTDGKANFISGVVWEQEVSKTLKSIGFKYAIPSTPRSQRDKDKVDIINENEEINGKLPYNFQCKASLKLVSYARLLKDMPEDDSINVIMHEYREGNKYAILKAEDFYNMVAELEARKL